MSRLVVVSNRVALPGKHAGNQGGLATGLTAALRERGGLWFGWDGRLSEQPELVSVAARAGGVRYVTTALTRLEFDHYYAGFANRALWPLCHHRLNLLHYNRAQHRGYREVNVRLARQLLPLLEPDDRVWIHDYHLMPLAAQLRAAGAQQLIGFFLHVPFPPPELLRALPGQAELLRDLLACDLIGFQTDADVGAFRRSLELFCPEVELGATGARHAGHEIRIGAFPIGIDVQQVARLAAAGRVSAHGRRLRESLSGRRLIIGVDRLDYSKGLPERFRAYGRLLETAPELHRKVVLLQIAPLSRAEVPEYRQIRGDLNAIAGDIFGRFAQYDWLPLRYMTRGFARSTVLGFLSLAHVGLVTPLRDGMNLVAKEYIAAQPEEDPGVLVLSSLAGAARELPEALIVNPYDVEGMAEALRAALSMPLAERQARWRACMQALSNNTIHHWTEHFLQALESGTQG